MLELASLRPAILATGHGVPMSGPEVAGELLAFAEDFRIPERGRYIAEPAVGNEDGIEYLPPRPPDPLPKVAAGVALAAALVGVGVLVNRRRAGKGDGDGA